MEESRIEIDRDLCNGCGLCVTVCPTGTISLREGKAAASGGESISCGHCEAVCPRKAVRVTAIDEEMSRYKTFTTEDQWLPPGKYSTSVLVQLMASRRSCRCFTQRGVADAGPGMLISEGNIGRDKVASSVSSSVLLSFPRTPGQRR